VPSITVFRITKAYWLDDRDKPRVVDMKNVADGGHLLVRIAAIEGADDFQSCSDAYAAIGKELVLKSPGRPDVRASAERGFWFDARASVRDFYVHIAPGEFAHMERGVRYTIAPVDTESATRWAVDDGVSVTRR
jgi:hypothetical protein